MHLRSTNQNPHGSQLNHRHFRPLSDFSQNTIQFNTSIYISKHFSHLNVFKYILKHLQQTFPITNKHILTLYKSNLQGSQINHRHFRQLSDFSRSRKTIQLTLFDSYIRTLYTSKRIQIYYKSSSTNISDQHQTYTHALQIKIYMDLK